MTMTTERNGSAPRSNRFRGFLVPDTGRQRARRTNQPFAAHDLKTARGRRIADLAGAYAAALGNPSDIGRQAEIVTAAELQVLAEETRALALANPAVADLDAIVRVQGAADRALRRLRIKPGAVADKTPTIHEIAARHRNGSASAP
jgi:hypothetical protein